ncbi:MAG: hypothetical protein ACXWCY_31845 [Burkholderiales bacterium]
MSELCLTRDELKAWSGAKRRADVIAWLAEWEVIFVIGRDMWPRVDRDYYKSRMSSTERRSSKPRAKGPNMNALMLLQQKGSRRVSHA